jgi:hypothetical protein
MLMSTMRGRRYRKLLPLTVAALFSMQMSTVVAFARALRMRGRRHAAHFQFGPGKR